MNLIGRFCKINIQNKSVQPCNLYVVCCSVTVQEMLEFIVSIIRSIKSSLAVIESYLQICSKIISVVE